MNKEKLYFSEIINEEKAYTKSYLIDEMKERELFGIIVSEAVRLSNIDHFFCKYFGLVIMKEDEPCGKECAYYEPRNGKRGCCKNRGFCYEPGKEFILKVDGKIKNIEL